MGIKKLIMILATLGLATTAFADNHEGENKPFQIKGDFAGSMQFYDNENNHAAVSNHDDFKIDLVEINVERAWSKSKLHTSISYGTVADAVNFGATNRRTSLNTVNLTNAYYHFDTSYGLGFTFGKFESPVGHEVYNIAENSQYTRSYGFGLAPFFSTGAMLKYGQDKWSVGLIVSNGAGRDTDLSTGGPANPLAGGATINVADANKTMALVVDVDPMENLHVDLNYVTGTEGDNTSALGALSTHQINILDVSVAYMINEMFDVAVNYIDHGQKASVANSTENKANSIAAYVNGNFGMFGLGLRYEQFTFDQGILLYNGLIGPALPVTQGTDNTISSITLTGKYELDQNAMITLEYRQDTADDAGSFRGADWSATNTADVTDSFSTITLGLTYRY